MRLFVWIALGAVLGSCGSNTLNGAGAATLGPSESTASPSDEDSASKRPLAPGLSPSGDAAAPLAVEDDTDEGTEADDDPGGVEGQATGTPRPHPLDGWSREKLEAAIAHDPASIGSVSLGAPNGGALFNPVPLLPSEGVVLVDAAHAFGTVETIEFLSRAITSVRARFPATPAAWVGHISGPTGGHLSPHVSHQSGRDVDVSYFYLSGGRWYARATATNLDRARTWGFVRALVTETDVEFIFIDRSIQRLLREYAYQMGEDRAWVDALFEGGAGRPPLICHAKGHATHIHVRFYNPIAQETGRRVYDLLVRRELVRPAASYAHYRVRKGDTLGALAKRFGTTPKAIQQANDLKTSLLRVGADFRIPQEGALRLPQGHLVVPPRRLPPTSDPRPIATRTQP